MNLVKILLGLVIVLSIVILKLIIKNVNIKKRLRNIYLILDEIERGNDNIKVMTHRNDITAEICYKINEIVAKYKAKIIELEKGEEAHKQLLTSLSHDVRTPLTTLIGYLEAIHSNIVTDYEKDECIEIARNKAYNLKDFVDILFEWFKLDSKERTFNFEDTDINELTRSIVADWIPTFNKKHIKYKIDISENELNISIDSRAYNRIISNLIQNALLHSQGNYIEISIISNDIYAIINISDNGKGIPEEKIPYIFDRLYKCDESRSCEGNGLGLSIVRQLVKAHKGDIMVSSVQNKLTTFNVKLPV
jgi:signal transduction histidine kinase